MKFIHTRWFKQLKLLVCFLIMIPLSAYMAFNSDYVASHSYRAHSPLFVAAVGWIGTLFFGGGFIFIIYKDINFHLSGRKMVEITDEGLHIDNDIIPWKSITGFRKYKGNLTLVQTNDCKKRINEAGLLRRIHMRISYMMTGTVYSFAESYIEGSLDDFIKQCNKHIRSSKSKKEM